MSKLTIIANIKAAPDKVEFVRAELERLIDITSTEPGCINYDLHQDNQNPAYFLFYENWKSRELWQAHMQSQHMKEYAAATEGAVEEFTLHEMTHIA